MLYNERQVSAYTRAANITIHNPRSDEMVPPSITFHEEHVVQNMYNSNATTTVPGLKIRTELTPEVVAEEFTLLHPETHEPIGTATFGELQVLLYSLYFHESAKRDEEMAK